MTRQTTSSRKSAGISARDRRALRVGAAAIAPIILYAFVLLPFARHVSTRNDAIERERDLLVRERALLAAALDYPARMLAVAEARADQRHRMFTGPEPLASTAGLASYVGDLAAGSEVRVERVDARTPEEGDGGTMVRVTLAATGDVAGLMRWLDALENGPRAVILERLSIGSVSGASEYPQGTGSGVEALELSLDLLGFARSSEQAMEYAP